jgi:hypothetical protein
VIECTCRHCRKIFTTNRPLSYCSHDCWYEFRLARKLPLAPLDALVGSDSLADRLGVNPRIVSRARKNGVTLTYAEDWADVLGVHPVEVWGDAYLLAVDWEIGWLLGGELGPPEAEPGNRFCGRRLSYRVPDHVCAREGCYCGRETQDSSEVAA